MGAQDREGEEKGQKGFQIKVVSSRSFLYFVEEIKKYLERIDKNLSYNQEKIYKNKINGKKNNDLFFSFFFCRGVKGKNIIHFR